MRVFNEFLDLGSTAIEVTQVTPVPVADMFDAEDLVEDSARQVGPVRFPLYTFTSKRPPPRTCDLDIHPPYSTPIHSITLPAEISSQSNCLLHSSLILSTTWKPWGANYPQGSRGNVEDCR
jgi:hypothetical protein